MFNAIDIYMFPCRKFIKHNFGLLQQKFCFSFKNTLTVIRGSKVWWNEVASCVITFVLFLHIEIENRSVCKYLKGKAKLTLLYTDLRDIFYKTLGWDLNSHVPLLTVTHFVLQHLPIINIFSPSPCTPCYFLFSPLHLFFFLLSRLSQEREVQTRRQMLEEERRRREEAERRLQDETAHRQKLVEEEVKMREKHFSQVSGAAGGDGGEKKKEEGRWGGGGGVGELGERMRGETLKRGRV